MCQTTAYLEVGEICGLIPRLVIPDLGAAWEADGDASGRVGIRLGELCPGDLPHGRFLDENKVHVRDTSVSATLFNTVEHLSHLSVASSLWTAH